MSDEKDPIESERDPALIEELKQHPRFKDQQPPQSVAISSVKQSFRRKKPDLRRARPNSKNAVQQEMGDEVDDHGEYTPKKSSKTAAGAAIDPVHGKYRTAASSKIRRKNTAGDADQLPLTERVDASARRAPEKPITKTAETGINALNSDSVYDNSQAVQRKMRMQNTEESVQQKAGETQTDDATYDSEYYEPNEEVESEQALSATVRTPPYDDLTETALAARLAQEERDAKELGDAEVNSADNGNGLSYADCIYDVLYNGGSNKPKDLNKNTSKDGLSSLISMHARDKSNSPIYHNMYVVGKITIDEKRNSAKISPADPVGAMALIDAAAKKGYTGVTIKASNPDIEKAMRKRAQELGLKINGEPTVTMQRTTNTG